MKKIILLILLLVSCTKDEQSIFCWYCESFSDSGSIITKTEVDNLTPEEIMIFEIGVSAGIKRFIKCDEVITICKKKESN